MPRLIVKLPGGPKTVPVGEEAVTIGRTADNTLPLDVEGVSRRHAQILFVGKGYEIVDMGSRNGTKVNGQKVPRAMLKGGDVVHVGGVDMVFEDGAGAAAASEGLDIEELDLGGAQASAPSATSAAVTMSMPAGSGGTTGECLLRVIDGEKKGTEIPLKGARTTFGRRATNTVSFQDAGVSGVHCEITREANGYVLRDLGSTNGTLVDGEPVVELLLRHNSRIRIGAQRVLFVDPTVADIESSLAGADDGAEWGLMRGEIDVTASRGRGGRGALAAVVVLAAAGGAGWWVFSQKTVKVGVEGVKDNLVTDFSFDDEGVVRWFALEEGAAGARIVGTPEAPRAASGVHSLEVQAQGEGLSRVEFSGAAQGGADNSVAPDTAYEVSAKVGAGSGAVVVVWISSTRPGIVREVSTPVVEGGASWPATRAVVTAPAHATSARIHLAAFGGRPATFDDVVFRRAESGAAQDLTSEDLRVRLDAGGFLEAVRGGEVLLTQGGPAPSVEAPIESLLGAALAAPPAHSGSVLSAAGASPGGGAFEIKAESTGGGAILSCTGGPAGSAFTFTCPSGMGSGAVTLVLETTALVLPQDDAFRKEGVRKIIVGASDGPQPFVLSADPASPGFEFTSLRTPRGLRVRLAPPAGASPAVRLSVNLALENDAAALQIRRAKDLEAEEKYGQAAMAYEQAALAFHYLPDFRKKGEEGAAQILREGKKDLDAGREAARNGRQFDSAPDLERAIALLDPVARRFEKHPFGTAAAEGKAQAEADLARVRERDVARRVEQIYNQAADLGQAGQPALQLLHLEEVLRIAPPGNEFAVQVGQGIDAIRRKVEEEREKLYGPPKR